MLKYLRDVKMIVDGGALTIRDLKIAFDVKTSISSENNNANFQIYNLTKAHRSLFAEEFREIEFEAGYSPPTGGSSVSTIFKGFIRDVKHERAKTDIITHVACGDGDKATQKGTITKTHPKGTKPRVIIEDLVSNGMPGVELGELLGVDDLPEFRRPVSVMGPTIRELNKLSRTGQFHWMITDGVLEIIPKDGYFPDVYIVSQDTGMVNIPTVTDKGIDVSVLLEPKAKPGRLIDVRSETVEMNDGGGLNRVHNIRHYGDNRDGDFFTDFECTRIS